ncbi:MAG: ATP-binding protein [Myxococcales bacterium]|nr:ATP-binding protein [Myxococcales bacterium]
MEAVQPSRACPECEGRMYRFLRREERAAAEACSCVRACQRCSGTGYLYVTREETFSHKVGPRTYQSLAPCPCKLLERRLARFDQVGIPAVHAGADFERYRPASSEQARARELAVDFAHRYPSARGFVISGPVGTGKTHLLAAALAHSVIESGARAKYVEMSLLYATIRRGFQEGKSGGEIIGPLSEVDLLAIDELGKGRGSPFELETLDELIARRYNAGRTTLFATNYSLRPPEQKARLGYESTEERKEAGKESRLLCDRVGDRIYSRLFEMCEFVEFLLDTPDFRRHRQELAPAATRKPARR